MYAMLNIISTSARSLPYSMIDRYVVILSVYLFFRFRKIMTPGSSEPWIKVLFDATGETRLDGQALREYFRPLEEWLRSENIRTGEYVGWTYDGDYCKFRYVQ